MKLSDIGSVWSKILLGYKPFLSLEITRECPLRCPGCYAYEPAHLGPSGPLRQLNDYKGDDLVAGVPALVRRFKPIHLSIVGGEPLVRHRELGILLPKLAEMNIQVQLVTSAVRPIPAEWQAIRGLHLVVSVDGSQREHDKRRSPATYERILKHIEGHKITVHYTITRQQLQRPNNLSDFASFWSEREEVQKIWFSLFTPQEGKVSEERLDSHDRRLVLEHLARLKSNFSKIDYQPQSSTVIINLQFPRWNASSPKRRIAFQPISPLASRPVNLEDTRFARNAAVWHRQGWPQSASTD
jgi:organic radical activating enzyme